VHCKK